MIGTALFLSLLATLLACIEIEIEGRFGWAEKLPTWYRTTGFWARAFGLLMGGKSLTGYHLFMFGLPFFILHAPFFLGTHPLPWSPTEELNLFALFFAWAVAWDYHWFALNPYYKGFAEKPWWLAKSVWIGKLPMDYIKGVITSLVFAGAASALAHDASLFKKHLGILAVIGAYTLVLKLASPLYHRWYVCMRLRDDRVRAGITHHL